MKVEFGILKLLLLIEVGMAVFAGDVRQKRQLFREDIPRDRPLDGSYNQRPQGENNQNENTIENDDHFHDHGHNFNPDHSHNGQVKTGPLPVQPVRFSEQDAKHSPYAYAPASSHDHGTGHGLGQGNYFYYSSGPTKTAPQHQQQHQHPHPHPPPPPPVLNRHFSSLSTGLLDFHQNAFPVNRPVNRHSAHEPFENKLHALWKINYNRNVPSPENRPHPFAFPFPSQF